MIQASEGSPSQAGTAADHFVAPTPDGLVRIRYLGDYELLEVIAHGGMGVVYKARQVSLNRMVAVKMIMSGHFAGEEELARFKVEAQAAASLDHANIVAIHEIGIFQGLPYFSMQLVAGKSLKELADEICLPGPDAREGRDRAIIQGRQKRIAALMAKVARAVQFAHQRQILHRDLKPANILVDENNEPRIADFGLAKRLDSTLSLSRTGDLLGTPAYMSPEQARGDHKNVTVATDIYSLGAVMFHLLTGRQPFLGDTLAVVRQVMEVQPVRPRCLQPLIDPDLETICLKCLEKDPDQRYRTAADLAQDLERWLNHEPVEARQVYRPRELGGLSFAALVFARWGGASLLVIGGLIASGFTTWPLFLALLLLNLLLGFNYATFCRLYPDGGGAYSAARPHGRLWAMAGTLLQGGAYLGVTLVAVSMAVALLRIPAPYEGLAVMGVFPVLGILNCWGSRPGARLTLLVAVAVLAMVACLVLASLPHLRLQTPPAAQGAWARDLFMLFSLVFLVSGVESASNLAGLVRGQGETRAEEPNLAGHFGKAMGVATAAVAVTMLCLGWALYSLPAPLHNYLRIYDGNTLGFLAKTYGEMTVGGNLAAGLELASQALAVAWLLCAANTSIMSFSHLLFVVSRHGDIPRRWSELNRRGVPVAPVVLAAGLPLCLIVVLPDFNLLRETFLYVTLTMSVATVAFNHACCMASPELPLRWHHRLAFGLGFLVLAVGVCVIAFNRSQAFLVAASLGAAALAFWARWRRI